MSTIGIQISSRAFGRSGVTPLPGWAAGLPSAWIAATSPGAIRYSPTSSMSTANRTGAWGSAGRNVGEGPGEAPAAALEAVGVAVADGATVNTASA